MSLATCSAVPVEAFDEPKAPAPWRGTCARIFCARHVIGQSGFDAILIDRAYRCSAEYENQLRRRGVLRP